MQNNCTLKYEDGWTWLLTTILITPLLSLIHNVHRVLGTLIRQTTKSLKLSAQLGPLHDNKKKKSENWGFTNHIDKAQDNILQHNAIKRGKKKGIE